MAVFSFSSLAQFESGQTTIKRPRELTFFSFDDGKQLHPQSLESLRYYYPPFFRAPCTSAPATPPINLSNGFQDFIKADDSVDGHLNALLETIQAHEEKLMRDGNTPADEVGTKAEFITWRGMMTKIMTAPYDIFSDFEMNATCFQGTIYIEEHHDYKRALEYESRGRQPSQSGQPSQELMQYWGYKFETLSVLSKPWSECSRDSIESRDAEVVNNIAQFCSIVRTRFGKSGLVLGGEVDCVLREKPADPDENIEWVELKTSAELPGNNPREVKKFERKLLRFWAQSFLLGVPKVVVGFRTPDGYLTRLQEFETQRIPGMVSRGARTWNGNACINMTAAFLEFLKATIKGEEGVWRIKRPKNSEVIEVFKIEQEGTGKILPEGFKAHRKAVLAARVAQKLGEGRRASTEQ